LKSSAGSFLSTPASVDRRNEGNSNHDVLRAKPSESKHEKNKENIMATKSKTTQKRTKAKDIPKSKKQMTGKDMRKVKGGQADRKAGKDQTSLNYTKIEF
jgi:hypothetical protein